MFRISLMAILFATLTWGEEPTIQEQAELLLRGDISIDSIQSQEVFALIRGGDIIGNGGGIVEIQLQNAFASLDSYISDCLNGIGCAINPESRELLGKVQKGVRSWPLDKINFLFISGNKYPKFFAGPDEIAVRSAKTGTKLYSPIFVNTDHLYDENSGLPLITYAQAISLVFHEIGHHQGIREHSYLDRLGNALGRYITAELKQISTFLLGSQMKLMALNRGPTSSAQLWWIWGGYQINFSSMVLNELSCPRARQVVGHKIGNLSWQRSSFDHQGWSVGFTGWVTVSCEDASGALWDNSIDISGGLQIGFSRAGAFFLDSWLKAEDKLF